MNEFAKCSGPAQLLPLVPVCDDAAVNVTVGRITLFGVEIRANCQSHNNLPRGAAAAPAYRAPCKARGAVGMHLGGVAGVQ
jgi:hypothetical protein